MQTDLDAKTQKQTSNAKTKELTGNDIFGPPPEIVPRSMAAARTLESKGSMDMGEPLPRNLRTSVKVSNVSVFYSRHESNESLSIILYWMNVWLKNCLFL